MRRKRRYIPMVEIAASALADKLWPSERDLLRAKRVSAQTIVKLFTPDHLDLHCLGGADRWYNLDLRRRGPELLVKDRQDTSRAAKVKRINRLWGPFLAAMMKGQKPKPAAQRNKLRGRGFDKSIRRRMDGTVEKRK